MPPKRVGYLKTFTVKAQGPHPLFAGNSAHKLNKLNKKNRCDSGPLLYLIVLRMLHGKQQATCAPLVPVPLAGTKWYYNVASNSKRSLCRGS